MNCLEATLTAVCFPSGVVSPGVLLFARFSNYAIEFYYYGKLCFHLSHQGD